LVEVWHAATKAVRNVDTPARYGGDEFAIVLPEAAEDAAHEVASRLRTTAGAQLLHSFGAESLQAKVTLSIGIVTLRPHDFISAEQLLFMADTQLYAAKKAGKNRIA
jgi:diguanylate cyclase (GGDEF)-like protein